MMDTDGPDTTFLYTDSAGVETETSNSLNWEKASLESSLLPKSEHDHTSTDRLFLSGSTMANVPIVVDLATTLA